MPNDDLISQAYDEAQRLKEQGFSDPNTEVLVVSSSDVLNDAQDSPQIQKEVELAEKMFAAALRLKEQALADPDAQVFAFPSSLILEGLSNDEALLVKEVENLKEQALSDPTAQVLIIPQLDIKAIQEERLDSSKPASPPILK